jgi:hypothetical protein
MILVERTHGPLVLVGRVPDGNDVGSATDTDEARLWTSDELRLVLIVAGGGVRARAAQHALYEWLCRHRALLKLRTVRYAWVIEDDTLRACAEAWQRRLGNTLFGVDAATFRAVRPALRWVSRSDSAAERAPAAWPEGGSGAAPVRRPGSDYAPFRDSVAKRA